MKTQGKLKIILLDSFIVLSQADACLLPLPCNAESDLTKEEMEKYLEMDWWAFDQSPKGWRAIETQADDSHDNDLTTAKLLDLYFERHQDKLVPFQRIIISFHAGQCYAFAGDYGKALKRIELSFQDHEPDDLNAYEWNAYVRATIAFLKKDKESLLEQREKIAGTKRQTNLKVVDLLIENFNASYADAYSRTVKKGSSGG